MPRSRTQKQVARRIDIFYFREHSPVRRVRQGLIVLCTLAAVLWIGIAAVRSKGERSSWLDPVTLTSIHNPGHLARPHTLFENRCETCHAGEKDGAFTRTVTDAACLHCHDGAIHRDNQKKATDKSQVTLASFTLAMTDANHPGGAMSAGCVHCHTEHRGEAELLGTDNRQCVVCHEDLKRAAEKPEIVPASVNVTTEFEAGKHPTFGRQLADSKGKWVDPTRLKFNHKFHLTKVDALAKAANNCTLCHSTQPMPASAAGDVPPFAGGSLKPVSSGRNGDNGYMRPITYAEHCSGCHPLNYDAGVGVSHVQLALARAQLADFGGVFRQKLAMMDPDARKKELEPAAPSGGGGRGRGRGAAAAPAKPMTEDEWVAKQLAKVKDEVGGWIGTPGAGELPQIEDLKKLADVDPPDRSVLEAYTVFGMANACAKCHDTNGGTMPGLITSATTQPAKILDTEPTGIPDSPRHWFANSRFDHRPHRVLSCIDCHGGAINSGKDEKSPISTPAIQTGTADVLSPDINRGATSGNQCVDCHKPGGAARDAATASCVSCHVFHDRSKERSPDGKLVAKSVETKTEAPATNQ